MALYSWFSRNNDLKQKDTLSTQSDINNKNLNNAMWPKASIGSFTEISIKAQAQLAFKNKKAEAQLKGSQTKTEVLATKNAI
jgi:hypothetical protein